MKNKFAAKLLAVAMAFAVAATAAPTTVEAEPYYSQKQVLYMTSTTADTSYRVINVSNLTKSQTIAKNTVKSSDKKVAEPYYLQTSATTYSSKTEYFENKDWNNSYNDKYYSYYLSLKLKKAGTATISFKIKGIDGTQKSTVTVKKYTNPVKSLKISGISSDLKNKTKSGSYVSGIKMTKTTKNATVKVTPAKGWKLSNVEVYDVTNDRTTKTYSYSKPMSSATLNAGTLTKGKQYRVTLDFVNTKDGGTMNCTYNINQ